MAIRAGNRLYAALSVAAFLLAVGAFALWWSTRPSADGTTAEAEPAVVEEVEGEDVPRVRLTQRAAERLDLQTIAVRTPRASGANAQATVPYSAVLYDTEGGTWVYTSPEQLVFVRAPVEVARIEGRLAFLATGPPAGTPVVSVGAAELYGAELGVDH